MYCIRIIFVSLTCKRSCCFVNKNICNGISQKIPNAQVDCISKKSLSRYLLTEYNSSIIKNAPLMPDKNRNILSRIISNFVAVRGRGQQQANNKSTLRKAIILSSVGAVLILTIFAFSFTLVFQPQLFSCFSHDFTKNCTTEIQSIAYKWGNSEIMCV